jgi:hypothetical protein
MERAGIDIGWKETKRRAEEGSRGMKGGSDVSGSNVVHA